jgi:hypothetical protein
VHLQPAFAHQREAAVGALAELVGKRPDHRRQREGADLQRLREEREQAERVGRTSGAAVEDEVSERRQAAESLLERRLPDRVQDEVDPTVVGELERFVRELLSRVVDDRVGAVRGALARVFACSLKFHAIAVSTTRLSRCTKAVTLPNGKLGPQAPAGVILNLNAGGSRCVNPYAISFYAPPLGIRATVNKRS